mmetsp:Transcript_42410/g.104453  ORF Transcript_42410/g.104453 Transcript_42410/m.104453 type:complete len:223 (-) Transcript_42410:464-1132(-)
MVFTLTNSHAPGGSEHAPIEWIRSGGRSSLFSFQNFKRRLSCGGRQNFMFENRMGDARSGSCLVRRILLKRVVVGHNEAVVDVQVPVPLAAPLGLGGIVQHDVGRVGTQRRQNLLALVAWVAPPFERGEVLPVERAQDVLHLVGVTADEDRLLVAGDGQRRAGTCSGAELQSSCLFRRELGRAPFVRGGVLGAPILPHRDAARLEVHAQLCDSRPSSEHPRR